MICKAHFQLNDIFEALKNKSFRVLKESFFGHWSVLKHITKICDIKRMKETDNTILIYFLFHGESLYSSN